MRGDEHVFVLAKMHKGQSWLVRYKPLEYLERVLTLAKEAYASYMNNGLILSMVNLVISIQEYL